MSESLSESGASKRPAAEESAAEIPLVTPPSTQENENHEEAENAESQRQQHKPSSSETKKAKLQNDENSINVTQLRNELFQVGALAGNLCQLSVTQLPLLENGQVIPPTPSCPDEITTCMTQLLLQLLHIANATLQISLYHAVTHKMTLNAQKYPVQEAKGKSNKYTEYSQSTGIDAHNQSIALHSVDEEQCWLKGTIVELAQAIDDFSQARDWQTFHLPRNIVLALMGEVGELCELVQWSGDSSAVVTVNLDKLSQELADVTIYLLRLSTLLQTTSQMEQTVLLEKAKKNGVAGDNPMDESTSS